MVRKIFLIAIAFLSIYLCSLEAQVFKPVKWNFTTEKISDTEYYIVFTAKADKGWNVYSQFTADNGPVPTSITYENKSGVKFEGKSIESGHKKEGPDKLFEDDNGKPVYVIKFLPDVPFVIKQKIKVLDASKPLSGYVSYMTCNDERCLPPEDVDFSFKFEGSKSTGSVTPAPSSENIKTPAVSNSTPATVSNGQNTPVKKGVETVVAKNSSEKTTTESPKPIEVTATDTASTTPPVTEVATIAKPYVSSAKIENGVIDQMINGLVSTFKSPKASCDDGAVANTGYFWTFVFGFLGGLFALLTPCVFPMIPITVSFFTKDTKRKGWMNGLIYGLSIIVIYVVLGLLITAIFGPEALNRLSTNWIANTLFFIIFIVFAFSFFGYYEITLPSSWSTKSDQMADKGGLLGIFFMAFTLALVSFSCTGPIIGSALVSAASKGEYLGPFLVMFGFSLALALPFGLFAAFPAWLNSLPKSGSWMNSVKVVLGFLELALALKFLSVADMTNHWGFLRYELFMGLWILVFFAIALYLFGYIKFPHDSPLKKLSASRIAFGTLAAATCIYLATGFMTNKETKNYKALSLMSGLAPPANYNFFKPSQEVNTDIKSKYPSFTKCANNIDCFKDYYEGLAYAKETKKPMLIDFTGYGCVNCRKTEEHIWVDEKIRSKLNDEIVLVSLYVDDDNKLKETLISKSRGNKIRNVGNMWADFQIVNFEQNSQPLYVMINPQDESVLAKPRPFKEGIDGYLGFLDCAQGVYK
jgi:thiol:disulfide interchange protein